LIPQWPYLEEFKKRDKKFKQRQKKDFDHHNRVHKLSDIPDNADVWIQSANRPTQGQVISAGSTPQSYVVSMPTGTVQQNHAHLRVVPNSTEQPATEEPTRRIMTRRQTGTEICPSDRLNL